MDFQPNDILLAFKHICLTELLNGSEKQVAAFLVNSYNRRTGRCDPSLHTASVLLRKHERTIIRAIDRLASLNWVKRRRHGGHSHCNSYQPNWPLFRALEQEFKARQREHSNRFARQEMSGSNWHSSPLDRQSCHAHSDRVVTQTFSMNPIQVTSPPTTYPHAACREGHSSQHRADGNHIGLGDAGPVKSVRVVRQPGSLPQPRQAAAAAALRRWNNDLLTLRSLPCFADIVDAIDPELERAATESELARRGAGLERILQELASRDNPGGGRKSGT